MAKTFKPDEQGAWVAYVRSHLTVLPAVERKLKKAGFPPLTWYDVLLELDRAKGQGLRPSQLCRRLLLAKFNLSRLLDRMEGKGLLQRKACPSDSRGTLVHITAKGRNLRTTMWPVYYQAVQDTFHSHFSASELKTLKSLLDRLEKK